MGRSRCAVVLLLLIGATLSGVTGTTTGQRHGSVAVADGPTYGMDMTRTYHLTPDEPGSIRIELTYAVGRDSQAIGVYLPAEVTVEQTDGFDRDDNGNLIARSDRTPSVTLTVPVNETNSRFGGTDFVDAGGWALVSAYTHSAYWSGITDQWEYEGQSDRVAVNNTVAGEGYAGTRFAYLGAHRTDTTLAHGQTFNLIVPAETTLPAGGQEITDLLEATAASFTVGARPAQVNVFVAPDAIRGGGLTNDARLAGQQDLWVSETTPASSVLIHEYIHTRQEFRTTNRTRWLIEGSAEYYELVYGVQTGVLDYGDLERAFKDDQYADAVLADNESWEGTSRKVDYRKGSRVIAALDARIRMATDGEGTFQDVMGELNARDGEITLSTLKSIVEDVAGKAMDDWIDRYVTTSAAPTYPDDPDPSYYLPEDEIRTEPTNVTTETATSTTSESSTAERTTVTASGPGFGVLAALLAVALLVVMGLTRRV